MAADVCTCVPPFCSPYMSCKKGVLNKRVFCLSLSDSIGASIFVFFCHVLHKFASQRVSVCWRQWTTRAMADEDDFPRGRGAEPTALEYRRLAAQAAHDVTGEEVNFSLISFCAQKACMQTP